jgi:tRNA (cytidine/uridine-2'-O-)-methyltransferase
LSAPIQLVLVTPEIPANTGNIVRLCACADVPLHLVEPLGFSIDDRVLKRAGLDYWDQCKITRHLVFEEIEDQNRGSGFLFLSARADRSFFEAALKPGDFLVLGPESSGLTKQFLSHSDRREHTFRIPMPGNTRSLNLSTAAGIVVYEALRRLGALDVRQER